MLDKLNRNRILILLALLVFSCDKGQRVLLFPDTEISCPDGVIVLIKYAKMQDVRNAIINHVNEKKLNGTSENYTVIKLPDNRSLKIDKKAPEHTLDCVLRESNYAPVKAKYIYGSDW